jgi:WD40 repeat protein
MFSLHCSNHVQRKLLLICLSLALLSAFGGPAPAQQQRVAYGVTAIAFSADGRLAAITRGNLFGPSEVVFADRVTYPDLANSNNRVEIWETGSGKLRRTFSDFGGMLIDARLSPDGRLLATTTWEIRNTEPNRRDTARLVDAEGMLALWDTETGELRWSKRAFGEAISVVTFSPDGSRIAVIGGEWANPGVVKFFDAQAGAVIGKLNMRAQVGAVCFAPDGRRVAVRKLVYLSYRSEVKIYDFPGLDERLTIQEPDIESVPEFKFFTPWTFGLVQRMRLRELQNMVFSPDGRTLAVGQSGRKQKELLHQILCFETQTGKLAHTITVHREPVPEGKPVRERLPNGGLLIRHPLQAAAQRNREAINALAYTADGRSLTALNRGLVVAAWDSETGAPQSYGKSRQPATAAAFTADGRTLAFASFDGTVTLWDSFTAEHRQTLGAPGDAEADTLNVERLMVSAETVVGLAFSTDGLTLASVSDGPAVKLWDARAAVLRTKLTDGSGDFTCVAFSPDAKQLAAGRRRGGVAVFDPATSEPRREITSDESPARALAFSPDGQWLAAACGDGRLRMWEATTGRPTSSIEAHHGSANGVAFSPDGAWLASAGTDGSVKLWEARTGRAVRALDGHTAAVNAVTFSPDGHWLASAGADKTVRLWEVETGRLVKTLTGHSAAVNAVAFSPDGALLASGGEDGTVRLYGAAGWKNTHTLKGHDVAVRAVSFSPNGSTLAAAAGNNSIAFWDPKTGELKRVFKDALTVPRRTR